MENPDASRRRRALLVAGPVAAAVVVVVVALLASSGGSPHRPERSQIGASVNRLFNDRAYSAAQIDVQLAALQRTGATTARTDALWEAAEPEPPAAGAHRYDWRFADLVAGSLAAHRLRWLPIVDYSAPWAESVPGRDHSPPSSLADYAAYAAALAGRYGPGGSFWRTHPQLVAEPVETFEIWNEPDNPVFWAPAPDPSRYAELYADARDGIVAVDPGARVIVGGLAHPEKFLPAVLAARPDLRGHIDGVAIHPYAPSPLGVLARVRTARDVLLSLGLGAVPLYVTELGWTTHPPGARDFLPEALRPAYISSTIAALGHADCGIAAVVLYTWVTPERDPGNREDWFGIVPPDGGGSPDAAAFAAAVRQAAQPRAPIDVCGPSPNADRRAAPLLAAALERERVAAEHREGRLLDELPGAEPQ